jgi:multiple sugar transport system permease protein
MDSSESRLTTGGGDPSPGRKSRQRRHLLPYLLIAPAVVVATATAVAPLFYGVWLSLQDWYILRSPTPSWGGLINYQRLLQDTGFWSAFGRTAVWTLGTVAVEVVLGMAIALLLNRKGRLNEIFSALILLPWVTPFIVVAYAWRFLLDSQVGQLHGFLMMIGLVGNRSALSDPDLALPMIIFISGWKGVPFMVVALLAALKGIPDEYYEAARIDGAGAWQQYRHVTFPLIANTLLVISVVLGILAFYSFDLAWLMTRGGPGEATTIVGIRVFQIFFNELSPAYAATISSVMLVVLLGFSMLSLRLRRNA